MHERQVSSDEPNRVKIKALTGTVYFKIQIGKSLEPRTISVNTKWYFKHFPPPSILILGSARAGERVPQQSPGEEGEEGQEVGGDPQRRHQQGVLEHELLQALQHTAYTHFSILCFLHLTK